MTSGRVCVDTRLGTASYFYIQAQVAVAFGVPVGWYCVPYDCRLTTDCGLVSSEDIRIT